MALKCDSLSESQRHRSLLVVEDEEPCRRALKMVLRSHGFTVHAVASAEEAMEWLSSTDPTTSLMVVDVDLPGMCGLDLVRHVQAANRGIRPVLVTAADRGMVQRFCSEHDVEYFPKPLNLPVFLDAIEHDRLLDEPVSSTSY